MILKSRGRLLFGVICCASVLATGDCLSGQENAGEDLIQLVVDLLRDSDKDIRALAFEQVRTEAKGEEATKQFAAQLTELPPDAQVGLLRALADRGDRAARTAVLGELTSSDQAVRIAAIDALGSLGEASDTLSLVRLLTGSVADERTAARNSLERLPDSAVSTTLISALDDSPTAVRITLMEVLTKRRAADAVPKLLNAAVDDDSTIRTAAMAALGQLAGPQDVPGMIRGVLKAEGGAEQAAAEKAVMFVCARIDDPAKRAEPLLAAMNGLPPRERTTALSTLGRVGGAAALPVIQSAIADRESSTHAAGVRAISNWPDASIAPHLMALAKTDPHPGHRTAALRALIRVAPLPDERSDTERLALLKEAMTMCENDRERNLVIERARAVRIPEALRYVLPYVDEPATASKACETIVELAHHRGLREPNKAEFDHALDKVIATSRDATLVDRAKRYKNNQTWVRPASGD